MTIKPVIHVVSADGSSTVFGYVLRMKQLIDVPFVSGIQMDAYVNEHGSERTGLCPGCSDAAGSSLFRTRSLTRLQAVRSLYIVLYSSESLEIQGWKCRSPYFVCRRCAHRS